MVTLGFGFKTYVSYRMRRRRQKEVQKVNEYYYEFLREALPPGPVREEAFNPHPTSPCKSLTLTFVIHSFPQYDVTWCPSIRLGKCSLRWHFLTEVIFGHGTALISCYYRVWFSRVKAEVFWKNKGYQRDEDISDRNFSRQLIGLNDFGKTFAAKDLSVLQISSAYE